VVTGTVSPKHNRRRR